MRVELLIFKNKNILDFKNLIDKYTIANVYIKVNLNNISETRKELIKLNYTTRLFVTINDGIKSEYIFGKLKKSKGVFNEHCKNSIIRNDINHVIRVSSNDNDVVIVDNKSLIIEESRKWEII